MGVIFTEITSLHENIDLTFPHVYHTSDTVSRFHILKGSVDLGQWLAVGDEFVYLQFASHVIVHQVWQLRATFDAAKGTAFPYTAGYKLKRYEIPCQYQSMGRARWSRGSLRLVLISWPAAATPMTMLCPQPL